MAKNTNWLMPDGKREAIVKVWGARIPTHLYYYIGRAASPQSLPLGHLITEFFVPGEPTGKRQAMAVFTSAVFGNELALMVENPEIANFPLEVKLKIGSSQATRICPLYAVGIYQSPGFISFIAPEQNWRTDA